jgi:hypothetical protein
MDVAGQKVLRWANLPSAAEDNESATGGGRLIGSRADESLCR